MVGLDHGASGDKEQEHAATVVRNTRLGLKLFAVYLVLYVGFMLLSAFFSEKLNLIVFAGVNLAIIYGFGLIIAALALALIYSWACRAPVHSASVEEDGR